MTTEEIKKAVDDGKHVAWENPSYKVIKDKFGRYLIKHNSGHTTGLTWADGKTLSDKEDTFYIVENKAKTFKQFLKEKIHV